MHEPPLDLLLRRVDRLERELRWWRPLAIVPATILGLLALAGAGLAPVPDEVRARRFVLTDAGGREVGDFYSPSDGAAILFVSGPKGVISLGADGGGTYLHLRDRQAMNEVVIDVDNDAPGVRIKRDWSPYAVLAAGRDGPSLALYDESRRVRAVVGAVALPKLYGRGIEQRPPSSMTLLDKNGRALWKVP